MNCFRCPALTPLLQLITPSRASGTADHVQSLDDLFIHLIIHLFHLHLISLIRLSTHSRIQISKCCISSSISLI